MADEAKSQIDFESLKSVILKAAENSTGDLIYTVVCDICNELIGVVPEADSAKVLTAGNTVISRYVDQGIKIRKKPAARNKVVKATPKQKPANDLLAAANKKENDPYKKFLWSAHPNSSSHSYTVDIMLKNGHPVILTETQKVVMVINEETTQPITMEDAKIALSYHLNIDESAIVN